MDLVQEANLSFDMIKQLYVDNQLELASSKKMFVKKTIPSVEHNGQKKKEPKKIPFYGIEFKNQNNS